MAERQHKKDLPTTIQYEDFVPRCEWKEEPESTLLLLHLPGFEKEEVRVTYIHSSRTMRVTGQRPVTAAPSDAKRWIRFNQTFPVPQNCSVDAMYGNFKNGVLTIAMPKQNIINPELDNIPEGSGQEKVTSQRLPEASPGREKAAFSPPKQPPMMSSREEEEKGKAEKKKLQEEYKGKKRIPEPEERKLPEASFKKPLSGKDLGLEKKKKEKGIIEKIWANEMTNEDKKLLLNMGVAAVVIFAVGAYVSYALSSSSSSSPPPPPSSSSPSTSSSSPSKPE